MPEPSNEPVIQEIVTEQEPNKEEKVEEVAQQATKEDPEVTITLLFQVLLIIRRTQPLRDSKR